MHLGRHQVLLLSNKTSTLGPKGYRIRDGYVSLFYVQKSVIGLHKQIREKIVKGCLFTNSGVMKSAFFYISVYIVFCLFLFLCFSLHIRFYILDFDAHDAATHVPF